jgi:dipeptidyl aminopeptidase/acylaminoacyl peptidase
MIMITTSRFLRNLLLVCALITLTYSISAAQSTKRAMSFEDVMKFRNLFGPVFSDNGQWMAFESRPDRGDGHAEIRSVDGKKKYLVERGSNASSTPDGHFFALTVRPPAAETEDPSLKNNRTRNALALVNTQTGDIKTIDDVSRFEFTHNGTYLLLHHFEPKTKRSWEGGTDLVIHRLTDGTEQRIPFVKAFQVDSTSQWLVYTYADSLKLNGLFALDLSTPGKPAIVLDTLTNGYFNLPAWHNKSLRAAWLGAKQEADNKPGAAQLKLWQAGSSTSSTLAQGEVAAGWQISMDSNPRWTTDGERIFIGLKPWYAVTALDTSKKSFDLFDLDALLDKKELDVWHWDDPTISTQQKAQFRSEQTRTWMAVFHLQNKMLIPLANESLRTVQFAENPSYSIGLDQSPYAKLTTWDGTYNDIYRVNLNNGSRLKLLSQHSGGVFLSPTGMWSAFYNDKKWHLIDMSTGDITEVSSATGGIFYDESSDTPSPPGAYGFAGWVDNDKAFRVYDKNDIWEFNTLQPSQFKNITQAQGQKRSIQFRIQEVNPPAPSSRSSSDPLILVGYDHNRKSQGYYRLDPKTGIITTLIDENKRISFVSRVKGTGQMVYTRQTTNEYPDLWLADKDFKGAKKVTEFGKQLDAFWIGTSELVKWNDLNGKPLEGVLIKPGNYEPGKKYPVIVYYYELSNQRLHEFNQTVVNHRPSFNFYASNGYAIFLPDVTYDTGIPGYSATRSLVPGVQKIIDMGIADPKAIGLHGHSWSGYQTLHVIAQTDIFACAIAGAPVSNMISAYSGIRWGAGVARQFQYERGQSRIGGSLWEYPLRYIENSPVFYADRINTPLLIQHGDADEAVPWYQSIEMYLAMRRLGKESVFLQYRGEPHHLQKYANKLDYSIKMKEYFDHYLKGLPAASWITEGAPYQGK